MYRIGNFYPRPPRGGRRFPWSRASFASKFLSTPSARRATIPPIAPSVPHRQFLSTPSARRATVSVVESFFCFQISIHALREEGDVRGHADYSPRADFYPRPPRGGRPRWSRPQRQRSPISIHALREEGDECPDVLPVAFLISIHALREEGDSLSLLALSSVMDFYPRPPRGGRRLSRWTTRIFSNFYPRPPRGGRRVLREFLGFFFNFYPRPPRGGRRSRSSFRSRPAAYFYPRPPRGGRPRWSRPQRQRSPISIHALREEGDECPDVLPVAFLISIHALREEGDSLSLLALSSVMDFYPRPPRGGRPAASMTTKPLCYFYPRPPRGGRHLRWPGADNRVQISIHALREEGDDFYFLPCVLLSQFLSTPSARRATVDEARFNALVQFLSTPSARRATLRRADRYARREDFYPRPPRGGRQTC